LEAPLGVAWTRSTQPLIIAGVLLEGLPSLNVLAPLLLPIAGSQPQQSYDVPVSSPEEFVSRNPTYPCCTFRGSVSALDAATGKVIWKTYAISEPPKPSRKMRPWRSPP
jgi:outer membrane protein assembly factor BamB